MQTTEPFKAVPMSPEVAALNGAKPGEGTTSHPANYPDSPLYGSRIEQDYGQNDDALFNSKAPNVAILHEKPEHRIMIMLKAQGLSNHKIALKLDKSDAHVSQVLRQPWARQRLVQELKAAGVDGIQGILAATGEDQIFRMIDLAAQNENLAVAKSASTDLLDRLMGKPIARIEQQTTVRHITDDIVEVNKELAELEKEEARLTGSNIRN